MFFATTWGNVLVDVAQVWSTALIAAVVIIFLRALWKCTVPKEPHDQSAEETSKRVT